MAVVPPSVDSSLGSPGGVVLVVPPVLEGWAGWSSGTEDPDTTVVFCRTKATVHRLTRYLRDHKINAREIHGDLHQRKRNQVMQSMRDGALDVLVASDLAARGLDIEHISHVINYDLPDDPEVYVHRIGRTARAGASGIAVSFCDRNERKILQSIERQTEAEFEVVRKIPAFITEEAEVAHLVDDGAVTFFLVVRLDDSRQQLFLGELPRCVPHQSGVFAELAIKQ